MKRIVLIAVFVLAVYAAFEFATILKSNGELQKRAEYRLDFVDEFSMNSIRQDLIADAKKLGIELMPHHIEIVYADTEQLSYAQRAVGSRLGAQFSNKQVGINIEYKASILGLPVQQRVTVSKIKQVAAPTMPMRREMQDLLDSQ